MKIWKNDPVLGWYFIFLNPIFLICCNYCKEEIFFIDFIILIVIGLLLDLITHDDSKMEGEGFLL